MLRILPACIALACGQALALSPPEIFRAAAASVVVLETLDDTGGTSARLSATVTSAETVVTVCNGVESASALRIVRPEAHLAASLLARDNDRNLCLLAAPGLNAKALPAGAAEVAAGSRVYAVSNALGLGVGISDGVFSGKRRFPSGEYLQFSAPVSPGSEGGALVDESGRLLGIVDYRRRDGQNVNFALPAAWIDQVQERASKNAAQQQLYAQAKALVATQDWEGLLRQAETWAKAAPDNPDAWSFVVRAAREKKQPDAELRGWEALYRIDPSQRGHVLGLGWQLALHQRYEEALALAQRMAADNPADGAAWYLQGLLLQEKGRLDEAEKALLRAVEIDPWLTEAYRYLANIALARGNPDLAIATWRRLAGLHSGDANAQWGLVNAYLQAGRPHKAWRVVERLGEDLTGDPTYWFWRGRTLAALGAQDAACAAYHKSLEIKPDNALAWGGVGISRSEQQRLPEAIAAFREARRHAPGQEEWAYLLAVALKDGGHLDEALVLTTGLLERSPQLARSWRQHGFVLALLGRLDEAVPALERSLQIEPRQAKVWGSLVEVNHQRNRPAEARQAYEKLRGFDSAAAESLYRQFILPTEAYQP
ncbi:serine protease [Accumulibacter sp.]|uniref:tetratricopeptide repeat protein n=1 Tax=Accumulibacter sp. TaxID=2053492 RepID=UPI00262EAC37|nr:serine protease [Accumulibacter sp.]